jgi:hypothetical protein
MNIEKSSNGRVDILNKHSSKCSGPDISKLFAMYDKIPANQCATFRDATTGLWDETSLSTTFFSKENIQIIQNGIRAGVYEKSRNQYVVGPQDCDSLKIIMRSVFLQHATNKTCNIKGQIQELNQMVLDYCIHHVYSEAVGYMKYLNDVNSLAVPLAPPVMASQNDRRTHKLPNWF